MCKEERHPEFFFSPRSAVLFLQHANSIFGVVTLERISNSRDFGNTTKTVDVSVLQQLLQLYEEIPIEFRNWFHRIGFDRLFGMACPFANECNCDGCYRRTTFYTCRRHNLATENATQRNRNQGSRFKPRNEIEKERNELGSGVHSMQNGAVGAPGRARRGP